MVLVIGRNGMKHNSETCALGNSTTAKKERKLRVKALRTALAADGESDESDENGSVQTNEIDSSGNKSEFPDHDDDASDTGHT